jgi:hypothetical protein
VSSSSSLMGTGNGEGVLMLGGSEVLGFLADVAVGSGYRW